MIRHNHYPFHRHNHCPMGGDHDKRYCSSCGVTYCAKCGKEWGDGVWPRLPWNDGIYLVSRCH